MPLSSLLIRILSIFGVFLLTFGGVSAACSIESGPSPLLVKYQKDTEEALRKIQTFAARSNQCTGAQGTFSNEKRFAEFFDTIGTRAAYTEDLLTDFRYSILLTAEWNSKWPVINQGKILENMEASRFVPVIKWVVWACALDVVDPASGKSPRESLSNMLEVQRSLVAYYKSVAVGEKTIPPWVEGELALLYTEIRDNYSPEITASCTPDAGVSNIQDVIAKVMERVQSKAKNNEKNNNDWEEALNLFMGKWAKDKAYIELQKRLLATELARQWLTQKAKDAMLKKLSCVQSKTNQGSDPAEIGKANYECAEVTSTIATNVTEFLRWLIYTSKTSDEFIERTLTYDTAKVRIRNDMWAFWRKLEQAKSDDETLNEKIITDLVNIHMQIKVTNDALKRKCENAYKNCMKAQPEISCKQC